MYSLFLQWLGLGKFFKKKRTDVRGRWSPRRRTLLGFDVLEGRSLPAAMLSITPTTWNVIGLDSNDVTAGPDTYLVGARVCNTGDVTANNVTASLVWDSANPHVNLVDNSSLTLASLAPGECQDFFFTAQVTRTSLAYNTTRQFHITASADGVASVSTPTPRELYVEELISQNRNNVLNFTGPSSVLLGGTYNYTMQGETAANYEQLVFSAAFPNTIFRIDSISTTYENPTGATNDQFYADASGWDNNPTSPTYRSSIGPANFPPDGKVGGLVTTTVTVTVVGVGTTILNPIFYDFSGNSYHYNTDFGEFPITVVASEPEADVAVDKVVNNPTPDVNDIVTFSITVTNNGPNQATGVTVTDQLPAGVVYVSDNGGGTYNPVTGVWNIGTLANGATVTLNILAQVVTPNPVLNTATVTSSSIDPDLSNNTDSADLTPLVADLEIEKLVNNPAPPVGGTITFTLIASNNGPNDANNVTVNDLLPAGFQYLSDNGGGAYNPGTGVWNIGTLLNGGSTTLTITAQANGSGVLTNVATISSPRYDPDLSNNNDSVNVTPGGQPPWIIVPPPQTLPEDTFLFFCFGSLTELSLAVSAVGNNPVEVTLTATHGTLTLTNISGLTFSEGDGTADSRMTFRGTPGAINQALNGMSFLPDPNYNGPDGLVTILVDDLGNPRTTAFGAVPINLTAVNDAPVNFLPGPQSTPEEVALFFATANGNAISIDDVDAGSSAVKVTLKVTNGTLALGSTVGLDFLGGPSSGANITFQGTMAAINAALNGLTFTPNANFFGTAHLTITTNDQGNTGAGVPRTTQNILPINVTPINDAPVLSVPGPLAINQGTVLSFNGTYPVRVTDDAGSNPIELSLRATNGTLTFGITSGLTFLSGGNGQSSLNVLGTLAALQTALNALRFTPTAGYTGPASVTVGVNDLGNTGTGGALTDSEIIPITINPVNVAPVNIVPVAQTMNEDATLVFSTAMGRRIAVSDVDAGSAEVQVSLSALNGRLTLAGTTGLTFVSGGPTNSAAMTFKGTLANINNAFEGLVFTPNANYYGTARITLTTNDLGNSGSGGAKTDTDYVNLTVNAVNDAPVLSVPNSQSTTAGTDKIFSSTYGNRISVSDVDAGTSPLQVTLTVTNGTLWLASTTGLTLVSGNGTSSITIQGSLTYINMALNGLRYRPATGFTGLDMLSILVSDLGNTGTGGALTDNRTVGINVL